MMLSKQRNKERRWSLNYNNIRPTLGGRDPLDVKRYLMGDSTDAGRVKAGHKTWCIDFTAEELERFVGERHVEQLWGEYKHWSKGAK